MVSRPKQAALVTWHAYQLNAGYPEAQHLKAIVPCTTSRYYLHMRLDTIRFMQLSQLLGLS